MINTEQQRDKLSIEINRLGMQCQQLKSTQERLVTEHSRTLEKVNELWKQKWPGAYDEVGLLQLSEFTRVVLSELWLLTFVCFFSFHAASLGGKTRHSFTGKCKQAISDIIIDCVHKPPQANI